MLTNPATMQFHDLEVELLDFEHVLLHGRSRGERPIVDLGEVVTPAVVDQIELYFATEHDRLEILISLAVPTRKKVLGKLLGGRTIRPYTHGGGRALDKAQAAGVAK